MAIYTLRSGANAHTEDQVLQLATDLVAAGGVLSISGNHLAVQQQTSPDMTVKVLLGRAYVKGATGSAYPVIVTADTNATIGANASGNPRIDAVVLYIDKAATPTTTADNVAKLITVQGTPAGSPTAPSDGTIQTAVGASNPFLRLANVTVASGATSIVTANIADVRTETIFSANSVDDWDPANEMWTYASADDPTFTFTIAGLDLTTKYSPGMRIKLTQTTVKYFIITKVAFSTDTTITVYGGTDYDLANAAITSPFYSSAKAPANFPLDVTKWQSRATDTTQRTQSSPSGTTWYNPGSMSAAIPIGCWRLRMRCSAYSTASGDSNHDLNVALSTANNSASDYELKQRTQLYSTTIDVPVRLEKTITLTSKTTYYCVIMQGTAGLTAIGFNNQDTTLVIEATCAYL